MPYLLSVRAAQVAIEYELILIKSLFLNESVSLVSREIPLSDIRTCVCVCVRVCSIIFLFQFQGLAHNI